MRPSLNHHSNDPHSMVAVRSVLVSGVFRKLGRTPPGALASDSCAGSAHEVTQITGALIDSMIGETPQSNDVTLSDRCTRGGATQAWTTDPSWNPCA